jgi:hypothetical protein
MNLFHNLEAPLLRQKQRVHRRGRHAQSRQIARPPPWRVKSGVHPAQFARIAQRNPHRSPLPHLSQKGPLLIRQPHKSQELVLTRHIQRRQVHRLTGKPVLKKSTIA